MQRHYLAILGLLVVLSLVAPAHAAPADYNQWLDSFKARALAEGVSPRVIEDALSGVVPDDRVVALDNKQPEKKITFSRYLTNTISQRRINMGREMMSEHRDVLARVSETYGVPAKYIVALWAIESDFGNNKGDFSVIQSLATLAYEGRRAEFFSKELIAALKILEAENIPSSELRGSWAGAMGNCQFMPSTYLRYAADGNGDGHRDIWNSTEDTFVSIAHYLQALGWDRHQPWGAAVHVPADFRSSEANIKHGQSASYWRKRGLTYTHAINAEGDRKIPRGKEKLYAIYPGTPQEGVYLVSENFQALLQWNRSRYFATSVGTLADAIGE